MDRAWWVGLHDERERLWLVMSVHKRALGISEDLVKISDRNLVHYFRKEIKAGNLTNIPTGARKRLKKAGIVGILHYRGLSGSVCSLTPYGEALLEEG